VRILHLTDRLSGRGGADWHLLGVINQQIESHHVELAVSNADGTATACCPVSMVDGLGARVRTPVDLEPIVARVRPDVVHVHNVVNPSALDWAADREAVMTVQDHRCFCPGRGKLTADERVCRDPLSAEVCAACFADDTYFHEMLALSEERLSAVRRMRGVTVLSRYMRDELLAVGVAAHRVRVIPPFVAGFLHEETSRQPACVLFAGRVVAAKGIFDAIEAWHRSGVDLPLVVAGTGAERRAVEELGAEVLGWVSHAELGRLYQRARAVVLPSRWQEPFGIVGLEALTFGVPVVAYDSGGVRDWHPGPGLVPWGDVDRLASALAAAVGRSATPPRGFEPGPLMAELDAFYRTV
jgi:glycosyltransferase involved in cell wall biosynthesis